MGQLLHVMLSLFPPGLYLSLTLFSFNLSFNLSISLSFKIPLVKYQLRALQPENAVLENEQKVSWVEAGIFASRCVCVYTTFLHAGHCIFAFVSMCDTCVSGRGSVNVEANNAKRVQRAWGLK